MLFESSSFVEADVKLPAFTTATKTARSASISGRPIVHHCAQRVSAAPDYLCPAEANNPIDFFRRTGERTMEAIDLRWNEFKRAVEMHHAYLELAIKLNLFYYAITGAILSFYFTHTEIGMAKYALGVPILLSAALAVFFVCAAFLAQGLRLHIKRVAAELALGAAPEGVVLVMMCAIFGGMLWFIFFTLVWFFVIA
jgi:hypothetical protein